MRNRSVSGPVPVSCRPEGQYHSTDLRRPQKICLSRLRISAFTFLNRNYWESTVTAEQTLYDFGATPSRYKKAVIGKEVAQLETQANRDDIFLLVAQTYFQVLRSKN